MKRLFVIIAIFSAILSACTLPTADEELSAEEIAQTLVAETEAAAPTETPAPEDTPTPTAESTNTPAPTSNVPLVSVSIATNCRTGPDVVYPLVLVFQPEATEEVVGKYFDEGSNYWIIKTPNNETCWLWGEYATVEGDTSTLPELAPPAPPVVEDVPTEEGGTEATATPTLAIIVLGPPAPTNFQASASCQIVEMNGQKLIQGKTDTITWDSSPDATGYKVYVNGVEEKDLNENAVGTNFDAIAMSSSEYGVAAYNNLGTSTTVTIPAPDCQ